MMLKIVDYTYTTLAIVALFVFFVSLADAGDVSRCYVISNPDARNYCRAVAKGDRSICATIQDADLRALCQAETG